MEPGSRKTSGGVDKDGIPIPPPPPVAPGLTKPLHIETGGNIDIFYLKTFNIFSYDTV